MKDKKDPATLPPPDGLIEESEESHEVVPLGGSALSGRLQQLKTNTINAYEKRVAINPRIPQPMFWSLFRSEIAEIKRKKASFRTLREILEE